ncbi:hypothetical protein D5086_025060 [Populus alba]|uniref:Uncharacterized protein n=1 Tax=Populus alba TaxID=43335 RepID=A0ACC4B8S7_POPAL
MALLDQSFFHYSLLAYYLLGPPTFIALRFFQFPYGKHKWYLLKSRMGPYNSSTFGLVYHGKPLHFAPPHHPLSLWPTLHKSESSSSHVSLSPPLLPPHFHLPASHLPKYLSPEYQNHYWFPFDFDLQRIFDSSIEYLHTG